MSATSPTLVHLPFDLKERTRRIAKRLRSNISEIVRNGLRYQLEQHEARFRAEEEQLRREKQEKEDARTFQRRIVSLVDPADLAPKPEEIAPTNDEPLDDEEDKSALADEAYRNEAEKIFAVLADPIERRIAAHTAVKTIREQRPLTAPSDDHVILRRLDKLIVKLQAKRPVPEPPGPATAAAAEPAAPPPATILGQFFSGLERKLDNK